MRANVSMLCGMLNASPTTYARSRIAYRATNLFLQERAVLLQPFSRRPDTSKPCTAQQSRFGKQAPKTLAEVAPPQTNLTNSGNSVLPIPLYLNKRPSLIVDQKTCRLLRQTTIKRKGVL